MISDLIAQDNELLTECMLVRYVNYLERIRGRGREYIRKVLDYIERENTPRSINYQLDLMKKVGFRSVEILHKNMCFGTFCTIK
ncbi:MAG: hypothetical protein LBN01_03750 [Endomicrobium sp.]|jgi:tRNA (cmo5U34)-methyltransferase|nr:hypothetical protein [Endomicrobium sp.]